MFIVVGNLLTIDPFAVNKRLRKRSLFLAINMAFADLMLGTVRLPIYIYTVWTSCQLLTALAHVFFFSCQFSTQSLIHFFSQAALISVASISGERFYAIFLAVKAPSTTHYYCYSVDFDSSYRHHLEYIVLPYFQQKRCVGVDAIPLDSDIHHMSVL